MKYDIVPIDSIYRGIERTLKASDLYTKNTKKEFNFLLNEYFNYLTNIEQPVSKNNLEKIIDYYYVLLEKGIECEIIAYDDHPCSNVYGYQVNLLGIDIIYEMCESLILENIEKKPIQEILNTNGLCDGLSNIPTIMSKLNINNMDCKLYWVYKLVC